MAYLSTWALCMWLQSAAMFAVQEVLFVKFQDVKALLLLAKQALCIVLYDVQEAFLLAEHLRAWSPLACSPTG